MNYRYEAHIVPGKVWDAVKIGDDYFGGVVVEGSSGMDNDLVLIVAYPTGLIAEDMSVEGALEAEKNSPPLTPKERKDFRTALLEKFSDEGKI